MMQTEQNIQDNSFKNEINDKEFLLSNVRLETGFVRDKNNEVIATETSLFYL